MLQLFLKIQSKVNLYSIAKVNSTFFLTISEFTSTNFKHEITFTNLNDIINMLCPGKKEVLTWLIINI